MINFDDYTNKIKQKTIQSGVEHNSKWPHIPDHPYRILTVGGSGSEKKKCIIKFNK